MIASGILAMFAGNVSRAMELADMYKQLLDPATITRANVRDKISYPARRYKTALVDEYLRRTWSVTREEYLEAFSRI